jgi:hypothetical protein
VNELPDLLDRLLMAVGVEHLVEAVEKDDAAAAPQLTLRILRRDALERGRGAQQRQERLRCPAS